MNNIIEQIASGENMVNVIADKVHKKEPTVLYSLKKLISVGLIEKKTCITEEKNKKKTQYVLKDYMFKFWYTFIPKACSVIKIGGGDAYYEKAVKPNLHAFMGKIFEDMCNYFTLKKGMEGRFDCFLTETGTWWGTETEKNPDGTKKIQPIDIDVVGISSVDKVMVVGECKFKNEKTEKNIFETLAKRSKAIPAKYPVKNICYFPLPGIRTGVLTLLPMWSFLHWKKYMNHEPASPVSRLSSYSTQDKKRTLQLFQYKRNHVNRFQLQLSILSHIFLRKEKTLTCHL